jgi:transposase
MAKPLSLDLRERIVEAVDADEGIRTVTVRFGVSPSAVSKIHKQRRETGSVAPAKMGGDRRSATMEAEKDWLLARLSEAPDTTLDNLEEYRAGLLAEGGVRVGFGSVWRFFDRRRISVSRKIRGCQLCLRFTLVPPPRTSAALVF